MCSDAYAALEDADAAVLITEWNEFRAMDVARIRSRLRTPVLVDLRNVYGTDQLRAQGIDYTSVGRA
jgi:UDPglucose 6-dehydrogenase